MSSLALFSSLTPEQLLVETPLYQVLSVGGQDIQLVINLLTYSGRLDAFCPACGKQSTFQGYENHGFHSNNPKESLKNYLSQNVYLPYIEFFVDSIFNVNLLCTRVLSHRMMSSYLFTKGQVEKVGMYPSLAQLTLPELRKYQSVLSKEKYKELNRGIGLTTHGVGVGAFIYLRRVFDDLLAEAHKTERQQDYWTVETEANYEKSRIREKINLLSHALPTFLVEQSSMYSILSKGVHELSEDECLAFFPAMKLGIELILDDKLERYQKTKKIKEAQESIAKINKLISEKSEGE